MNSRLEQENYQTFSRIGKMITNERAIPDEQKKRLEESNRNDLYKEQERATIAELIKKGFSKEEIEIFIDRC